MFDVNEQKKHVKHRIILLLILASFKMLNLVLASLFMLIEIILFSDAFQYNIDIYQYGKLYLEYQVHDYKNKKFSFRHFEDG